MESTFRYPSDTGQNSANSDACSMFKSAVEVERFICKLTSWLCTSLVHDSNQRATSGNSGNNTLPTLPKRSTCALAIMDWEMFLLSNGMKGQVLKKRTVTKQRHGAIRCSANSQTTMSLPGPLSSSLAPLTIFFMARLGYPQRRAAAP